LCGKNYGDDEEQDIAFRVIADHLRAEFVYCRRTVAIEYGCGLCHS